jgi:hypothetical protein
MNHSQEFSLSLHKYGNALKHLLAVNNNLVFGNDLICALYPAQHAFSAIRTEGSNSNDFSIHNCADLENLLNSRQIDEITVDLPNQKTVVSTPYIFSNTIPEVDDYFEDESGTIGQTKKRLEIIDDLQSKETGSFFTEESGKQHTLCVVEVENSILIDMIERIGEENDVTLETSDLTLTLWNEKRRASYPLQPSTGFAQTSVLLSGPVYTDCGSLQIFKSALRAFGEAKSKLIIADLAFLLVMQDWAVTLLNSNCCEQNALNDVIDGGL